MRDFLELADIWEFLKVRKKYWLTPLIITIILMGSLIIFTQGSVVAPFYIFNILEIKILSTLAQVYNFYLFV